LFVTLTIIFPGPLFPLETMPFPISFVSEDEYGVPYAARTFSSIEELCDEIRALEELLDESSVSRGYIIQAALDQLKQLAHEIEDEPLSTYDQ
jgi:hypothetical protein